MVPVLQRIINHFHPVNYLFGSQGSGGASGPKEVKVKEDNTDKKDDKKTNTGGTKSYSQAWKDYKTSGKTKYADEASFTKAAQDWNKKKYGSTTPTAEAASRGITKSKLGEQHGEAKTLGDTTKSTAQLKHEVDTYKKGAASGAITTLGNLGTQGNRNNISLKSTIDNANADASLMEGTKTRRQERLDKREGRIQKKMGKTTNKARTQQLAASLKSVQGRQKKISNRRESTSQEKENLLTQNPVDNRSKSKRGWDKDY